MITINLGSKRPFPDDNPGDNGIVKDVAKSADPLNDEEGPLDLDNRVTPLTPPVSVPQTPTPTHLCIRRKVGLRKLRNSCYMNSILQALFHLKDFRQFFLQKEFGNEVLSSAFKALYTELMFGEANSVSPHEFKAALQTTSTWSFARNEQQDAYEFLIAVLNRIHDEVKEKVDADVSPQKEKDEKAWSSFLSSNSSSLITSLFFGMQKSVITCLIPECEGLSENYEPFLGLSLAIPDPTDTEDENKTILKACFDLYLKDEIIADWDCPSCKRRVPEGKKKIEIVRFPLYLIVKLKRVIFGEGVSRRGRLTRKVHTFVDFPVEEDLNVGPSSFSLVSVVEHMGQEISGHYTTVCKDDDGRWTDFNDSRVHEDIDEKDVKTERAVLLFYESRHGKIE